MKYENLNKENFWNKLYEKYTGEVQGFCNWIDKYKEENNWEGLFNGNVDIAYRTNDGAGPWDAGGITHAPKFHDLPLAIQFGIFLQFVAESHDGVMEVSFEHTTDMNKIPELIEEYFFYQRDKALTDHQNMKYNQ